MILSRRSGPVCLFAFLCAVSPVLAVDATASPRDKAIQQIQQDLKSNDPAKIASAIATVRSSLINMRGDLDWLTGTDLLLAGHQFQAVDAMCLEGILSRPNQVVDIADMQAIRVRALLGEGKPKEALSVAKSFYDVAPLAFTNKAIDLLAVCLAQAHPEDHGIARRFRRQQVAGAAAQPSSQASDGSLGDPILPTIKVDPKPFEDAINSIILDEYGNFVIKGNLLLLADRPKEAREVFEQAYDLAPGDQMESAVENVARAIRAQAGAVGPANAYILSLRNKQK